MSQLKVTGVPEKVIGYTVFGQSSLISTK